MKNPSKKRMNLIVKDLLSRLNESIADLISNEFVDIISDYDAVDYICSYVKKELRRRIK